MGITVILIFQQENLGSNWLVSQVLTEVEGDIHPGLLVTNAHILSPDSILSNQPTAMMEEELPVRFQKPGLMEKGPED